MPFPVPVHAEATWRKGELPMPEFGDSIPLLDSEVSEEEAQPFFACGERRDERNLWNDTDSTLAPAAVSGSDEELDLFDDFQARWWPVPSTQGWEFPE